VEFVPVYHVKITSFDVFLHVKDGLIFYAIGPLNRSEIWNFCRVKNSASQAVRVDIFSTAGFKERICLKSLRPCGILSAY